jgi:hypothetical protein
VIEDARELSIAAPLQAKLCVITLAALALRLAQHLDKLLRSSGGVV